MIKKSIKLLLTTTIISTQLYLNAFAMDSNKDSSQNSISTKQNKQQQNPPGDLQLLPPKTISTPTLQSIYPSKTGKIQDEYNKRAEAIHLQQQLKIIDLPTPDLIPLIPKISPSESFSSDEEALIQTIWRDEEGKIKMGLSSVRDEEEEDRKDSLRERGLDSDEE